MRLVAKKVCSFGGKQFFIGQDIPSEFVINPRDLEKMGVLAIVDGEHGATVEKTAVSIVTVTVPAEEGDLPLEVTVDGLQSVIAVLTGKVSEAEEVIEAMTDSDALILLHMCDGRKTIKEAAETRAKKLVEEAGEQ